MIDASVGIGDMVEGELAAGGLNELDIAVVQVAEEMQDGGSHYHILLGRSGAGATFGQCSLPLHPRKTVPGQPQPMLARSATSLSMHRSERRCEYAARGTQI